jgi:hypothetical protein
VDIVLDAKERQSPARRSVERSMPAGLAGPVKIVLPAAQAKTNEGSRATEGGALGIVIIILEVFDSVTAHSLKQTE